MKKTLTAALSALMVSGCSTVGGDMVIRVSGSIPSSSTTSQQETVCQLEMISVETGEIFNSKDVRSEFSTMMMVVSGKKPKHYYFSAKCRDGRLFRSEDVAVSSRRSRSRTFDLGSLTEESP
ncbi:MAG: lipoprotein [Pseudomonadales bacterium]|uniref:lipoprotein n=1 Tax=Stenotrophomonas sp. ATs4 TaxID=3402766 RepID=UPI003E0C0377